MHIKGMIVLKEPERRYLKSYKEAYLEYETNNIDDYHFSDGDVFTKFDNYKYERNLKENRVGAHFYWLVDDERDYFIGEISIRHRLNDALERYGGHIGYGIRCGEWNKGYGTLLLKCALKKAFELGLDSILITCDDDNIGSYRVMEKNGFGLRDKIENNINGKAILTRRYVLCKQGLRD